MLYVLCRLGRDTYAIPSAIVERIVPYATLKALPGAPDGLVGILNYETRAVPVVDLGLILTGEPSRAVMSTRIIICTSPETASRRIGVLLEEVTRTARMSEADFQPAGAEGAACLDRVSAASDGLVQRLDIPSIFPPGILASLGLAAEFSAA